MDRESRGLGHTRARRARERASRGGVGPNVREGPPGICRTARRSSPRSQAGANSSGMRDRRFVATHRGGPLDRARHARLARWAADCAERVLPLFARCSTDPRPREALATARAWAAGQVPTGAAMKASVAAHAAARSVTDGAASAAARAAGQAVATAHFADHSMGALLYAVKALALSDGSPETELRRQLRKLPVALREPVAEGVARRLASFLTPRSMARTDLPPLPCAERG